MSFRIKVELLKLFQETKKRNKLRCNLIPLHVWNALHFRSKHFVKAQQRTIVNNKIPACRHAKSKLPLVKAIFNDISYTKKFPRNSIPYRSSQILDQYEKTTNFICI